MLWRNKENIFLVEKSSLSGTVSVLILKFEKTCTIPDIVSSPEHEVLMVSYCGQSMSVISRVASTIALKAYSSYTPGPIDLILGRKYRGDL